MNSLVKIRVISLLVVVMMLLAGCGGGDGAAITNNQLALPLTGDLTKAVILTGSEYTAKLVINPNQPSVREFDLVVDRNRSNNQTLIGAVTLPVGTYTLRLDLYINVTCGSDQQVKVGEFNSTGSVTVTAGGSTDASFGAILRQPFDADSDTFDNLAEIIAGSRWCDDHSAPAFPAGRYQISGNVTALQAGASAKLKLNNFAELSVSGNRFSFPDFVLNNSTYTVRVIQSPTGTVCTVSDSVGNSGTTIGGTVNSADITLSLACGNTPTVQHSLAVTVTGIPVGVSGVLEVNESKLGTQTFSVNGKKTFSTTLADNAEYSLSITAEPANLDCQFSGGSTTTSGTVGITDATVAVSCTAAPLPMQRVLSVRVAGLIGIVNGPLEVKEADLGILTFSADGTKPFTTKLADNSNYNLSITAKPSNFNCSFASDSTPASGSVGTTDVIVSVICNAVPRQWALSINVTGLSGSVPLGGVLDILEATVGTLSFSADETRSFPIKLVEGTSYSLNFSSVPGNYECSFPDSNATASGIMAAADAIVAVNCTVKSLVVFQDTLSSGGLGPKMVVIPAGSFLMGSPDSEPERFPNEGPQHQVTIGKTVAIGQTEVTYEDYDQFAKAMSQPLPNDYGWGRVNRPVVDVSWNDALAYTQWLSEQTSKRYRLPTEAEWEYASRAVTTTPFWMGQCIHTDQANYDGNFNYSSCAANTGVSLAQTQPVGSYAANSFVLYDTAGNVWEWMQDCMHEDYTGAPRDGSAWESASGVDCGLRVIRGGSWGSHPGELRSARRNGFTPDNRTNDYGFRLAQDL